MGCLNLRKDNRVMKKKFLGIILLLILISFGIVFAGCEKERSSSSYAPVYDSRPFSFALNAKPLSDDTSALFTSGEITNLNDTTPTYGEFKNVKMGAQYNSGVGGTAFRFFCPGAAFDLIVGTSKTTLETARTELQTLNSKIFLTSENWLGADRHNWLMGNGYSQWNDYFRETGKNKFLGMVNDPETLNHLKEAIYFSQGVTDIGFNRALTPIDTTNYLESHDEQTVGSAVVGSWAKGAIGATLLMTSLGIPMVYEGQEFCRKLSKEAQQAQNEETQAIDWTWASGQTIFYNYFKYVVNLRKDNPGFRIGTDPAGGYRTDLRHNGGNLAVGYVIDENQSLGSSFVVLLNMNSGGVDFTLPTIPGGSWDPLCAVVGNGDPYNNTYLLYKGGGIDGWSDGTSGGNWTLNGYSAVVFKRVP